MRELMTRAGSENDARARTRGETLAVSENFWSLSSGRAVDRPSENNQASALFGTFEFAEKRITLRASHRDLAPGARTIARKRR